MAIPHLRSVLVGLLIATSTTGASAQPESAPAQSSAPALESAPAKKNVPPPEAHPEQAAPGPVAAPAETAATEAAGAAQPAACFPGCRDGYLCHEGQCISACNPVCDKDEQCVDGRACVPKAHMFPSGGDPAYGPWPPLPPATADVPPPPSGFQPYFPASRGSRPISSMPRFQGYLGVQLGLGGGGKLELADRETSDFLGLERGFDLNAGGGVEGVMEFRVARFFGVGPGLRVFRVRADNNIGALTTFDLLIVPTFHIPLQSVEFFLPVPLGLSFGSTPSELYGDSSAGLTVGINPGLLTWLGKTVGIYGQLGIQAHFQGYSDFGENYVLRFHRPTVTVGLALRD